jgi:drug/metabolite transporter (DMT)-like permease
MLTLLLSIFFSVLLLVNFRIFPKFQISTFQAIAFNYPVCFLTGLLLMPDGQYFNLDMSKNWTWYCLALGVGFILSFVLSGLATQKIGMTLTSMANNVSLVIPVLISLFFLKTNIKVFDFYNYAGLGLAVFAVAISTFKLDEKASVKTSFWLRGGLALSIFVLYGVTNAAINYLNIHFIPNPDQVVPVTLVMVLGAVLSGLIMLLFRVLKGQEKLEIKNMLAGFTLGIPNFLSFYFLILTLTHFGNSGAYVYPVYNIGVILVSTSISFIFFKEKLTVLNKIGLLCAILAILLISWQELVAVF